MAVTCMGMVVSMTGSRQLPRTCDGVELCCTAKNKNRQGGRQARALAPLALELAQDRQTFPAEITTREWSKSRPLIPTRLVQ